MMLRITAAVLSNAWSHETRIRGAFRWYRISGCRIEAAKAANPALRIIVSDPRVTQSCASADLHLQLNPGTDIVLHHAIGRLLIEQGHTDKHFIQQHTEGFARYREAVMQRSIAEAAILCGIGEQQLYEAAAWIGASKGFMTMLRCAVSACSLFPFCSSCAIGHGCGRW